MLCLKLFPGITYVYNIIWVTCMYNYVLKVVCECIFGFKVALFWNVEYYLKGNFSSFSGSRHLLHSDFGVLFDVHDIYAQFVWPGRAHGLDYSLLYDYNRSCYYFHVGYYNVYSIYRWRSQGEDFKLFILSIFSLYLLSYFWIKDLLVCYLYILMRSWFTLLYSRCR